MPPCTLSVWSHRLGHRCPVQNAPTLSDSWLGRSPVTSWIRGCGPRKAADIRCSSSAGIQPEPVSTPIGRRGGSSGKSAAPADLPSAGYTPGTVPRICILGGGFGGLYTAVRLQSLMWPNGKKPLVTLIDKADKFVFKPLLYEVVNGTARAEDVAPSYVKLLSPYTVNFIQGKVQTIEPFQSSQDRSLSGGRVVLSEGTVVDYDWLVLSLGSEASTLGVPGVKEHAVQFNTIGDALQVQSSMQLLELAVSSTVVVVGSGPAGVELATTVADRLGKRTRVSLISTGPEILKGAPATHREAAEQVLLQKDVTVLRNRKVTKVKESKQLGPGGIYRRKVEMVDLADRTTELEADLVLWTAGSQPSVKATPGMELPFPLTDKGAMRTDDTLQVVGNPHVFALGDVASSAAEGQELASLPATAQVAFQQADYAAWNIWAAIHNRPLLPFRYQHLGDMMSLGVGDGAVTLPIQLPRELTDALQGGPASSLLKLAGIRLGNGVEKGVTLEGSLGALVRRAAYLYRQPTNEHRLEVGSNWLQQAFNQTSQAFSGRRRA